MKWRVTWWEGGPPSVRQSVERNATIDARTAEAALLELDRLLAADGRQAYAPVVSRA